MNIAIVGSGDIGSTLGRLWARAGHRLFFSFSHDFEKLKALADECGNGSRAVKVPYEAVSRAEVVLFSVPWTQVDEAMKQIGRFENQLVIDTTNPYIDAEMHVEQFAESDSSSESIARRLEGARVVKAFNTLRDETLWNRTGQGLVIFYAGDYPLLKKTVAQLIEDAGFIPYDVGTLREGKKQEPGTDRYLKELTLDQARQLVGEPSTASHAAVTRGEIETQRVRSSA